MPYRGHDRVEWDRNGSALLRRCLPVKVSARLSVLEIVCLGILVGQDDEGQLLICWRQTSVNEECCAADRDQQGAAGSARNVADRARTGRAPRGPASSPSMRVQSLSVCAERANECAATAVRGRRKVGFVTDESLDGEVAPLRA